MTLAAMGGRLNPMANNKLGAANGDREPIVSVTSSPSGTAATASHSPGAPNPHVGACAPQAGDWIEVDVKGEGSPRRGLILEVLGEGRHTHFRVRWDEEHVSLFYPAERGFLIQKTLRGDY